MAALERWLPDVVLLNLGMPDPDGYEVARRIRAIPRLHHLPLVAVSGWGREADHQRTRECGFNHHFVKPVRADEMLTVLGSLTHRSRA